MHEKIILEHFKNCENEKTDSQEKKKKKDINFENYSCI